MIIIKKTVFYFSPSVHDTSMVGKIGSTAVFAPGTTIGYSTIADSLVEL